MAAAGAAPGPEASVGDVVESRTSGRRCRCQEGRTHETPRPCPVGARAMTALFVVQFLTLLWVAGLSLWLAAVAAHDRKTRPPSLPRSGATPRPMRSGCRPIRLPTRPDPRECHPHSPVRPAGTRPRRRGRRPAHRPRRHRRGRSSDHQSRLPGRRCAGRRSARARRAELGDHIAAQGDRPAAGRHRRHE